MALIDVLLSAVQDPAGSTSNTIITIILGLAALVPLAAMYITFRQRTSVDYEQAQGNRINDLVRQLDTMREERNQCLAENIKLKSENLDLLKKIVSQQP